jgi:NAD-dependent deacetylase
VFCVSPLCQGARLRKGETQGVLDQFQSPVFLIGAGMSAESGVPPSSAPVADGVRFLLEPEAVQADYRRWRTLLEEARPHAGHEALRKFGYPLITFNVDGLLGKAGCEQVLEMHGSAWRQRCIACARRCGVDVSTCACGGRLRPDVVWDHEELAWDVVEAALAYLRSCDCLVCVGFSGARLPALEFALDARRRGAYLLEINPESTPLSEHCNDCWRGQAGELLPRLGMGEASSHR